MFEALVLEMARLARERDSLFVVAGISEATSMLRFAEGEGIATVDISLPSSLEYQISEQDHHPNARAARIYANRLRDFLAPILAARARDALP